MQLGVSETDVRLTDTARAPYGVCTPRRPAVMPRWPVAGASVAHPSPTSAAFVSTLCQIPALAGGLAATLATSGPTRASAPEAPITEVATLVAGTTAIINGELNPAKRSTTGYEFTYKGAATAPGAERIGKAIKVATPPTGLEVRTPYTFCLVASHTEAEVTELASGLPLTSETFAAKPVLVSRTSSGVTAFEATLEAQLNPENQVTTFCRVEYGLTTAYETGSLACEQGSVAGAAEQLVSANASGLTAATLYHYRVVVKNATGETKGADREFTTLTLEKPIVGSPNSSSATSTEATQQAQVNPNHQKTTYAFKYALDEAVTEAAVNRRWRRRSGGPVVGTRPKGGTGDPPCRTAPAEDRAPARPSTAPARGPETVCPSGASLPARTRCQQKPGAEAHLVAGNTPRHRTRQRRP
jgi:hypothetical protein